MHEGSPHDRRPTTPLLVLLALVGAAAGMPGTAQNLPASTAAAAVAAPPAASGPLRCAPRQPPAPVAPGHRRPAPAPAAAPLPVLQCGDAISVVTLAPAVAPAGSATAASAPGGAAPKTQVTALDQADLQWLRRTAYGAWVVLSLTALVLLVLGLVAAVWRGGIAMRGHSGGFGGRGSGWEVSPAVAMLAGAALAGVLSTVLMVRMLSATTAAPPATSPQGGQPATR
ncbi:hypothetical protein ACPOLB_03290 [Rubrivivax sp. RP6-9]|uniref:hypothetical protein n=1 Tax=Rubrivivax sp. RP6-9 TaxID=3415750 RepID=UPI003CC53DD1